MGLVIIQVLAALVIATAWTLGWTAAVIGAVELLARLGVVSE